jgi:glycosyltransferase involved in cell wall biosynthesis
MTKASKNSSERIKLGIVANEFFHPEFGGAGGFGWAARQVANLFNEHPEHGVEAVFLNRTLPSGSRDAVARVHGTPLMMRDERRVSSLRRLRAERFDLLLMIDYRPSYRFFAGALPRTPIIVWVRDPRPPEDVRKIATLRIPGAGDTWPQGIDEIDCTSLSKIVSASRLLARPLLFAAHSQTMAAKIPATYGTTPPEVFILPNIIELNPDGIPKSLRPRVVFLGRLDPIKRPWLFAQLAEQFPDVEFLFMGRAHFEGAGAWQPVDLPANVQLLGHLDGAEKLKTLASAWALINTSIHESRAISFLEALACETPLISCQNPSDLVSRFGFYVGRWDGDGRDGLPQFGAALKRLMEDTETRVRLGKEGRAWVSETQSRERFLSAFRALCVNLGVRQALNQATTLRTQSRR